MQFRMGAAAGSLLLAGIVVFPADPAAADGARNDQWHLRTLHVTQAHTISKGKGITVAVIDTGTYPHPDLKRNLLPGIDMTINGGAGDGQIDQGGHGTRMAALIAAHGRTGGAGVLGIAPEAKILPVRVMIARKKAEGAKATDLARGITWAADHHAVVINLSLGGGPDFDEQDAVNAALARDIVLVAAAGNEGTAGVLNYPGAYDGVLTVGATDRNGRHAELSVTDRRIGLCAPGVAVSTANPKTGYAVTSGTSDSTAIVSGAVALVRAKFPNLSGPDVVHRLTATADDIGPPGRDKDCGYGQLNIIKALTATVPPVDGAAPPSASKTPTSPAAAPGTTSGTPVTASAVTNSEPASSNTIALLTGAIIGVLIAAAAAAFLLRRRQRNPSAHDPTPPRE